MVVKPAQKKHLLWPIRMEKTWADCGHLKSEVTREGDSAPVRMTSLVERVGTDLGLVQELEEGQNFCGKRSSGE